MKWAFGLAALALAWCIGVCGLKQPRLPEASAVLSKQLALENEALIKRNQHLEAMMQMARSEVHRMDAVAKKRQRHISSGDAEVLGQEIQDLKKKLGEAQSEKSDLVQTLRRMLTKNSTQVFEKQAEKAQQQNMALELKFGQERQALEAQIMEANAKCDTTKEATSKLLEENQQIKEAALKIENELRDAREELSKAAGADKELSSDKANLVATMHALMRENTKCKQELQTEKQLEQREAKEVEAGKIMLTKLLKKGPAVKKELKKVLKVFPRRHHKHSEAAHTAAQLAKMKDIDKYIDSADADNDDEDISEQRLSEVQKQADAVAKGKVGSHLGDWLGFQAPAPPKAAAPVKAAPKPVDEATDLVDQAKAQLALMEKDDADGGGWNL